ncbi:MAG TPA: BTAD domain-containing putative transcriptional regulator [Ktedonobacteraceae bacterium]|nr:BTAD domain-containing putative transcriptional regulator [Ktedonobacteraceae bacterium]
MHEALLLRKIAPPVLPYGILHRETLVSRLQATIAQKSLAQHRLILLYAPAGYGKTTLLADYVRSTGAVCCWYFLDRTDTDRVTFLRVLLASLRQRFPDFCAALDEQLAQVIGIPADQQSQFYEEVVDAICAAMRSDLTEQFLLVFANYHEINEHTALTTLINYLIQRVPPHCNVVIESRAIPNIEFVPFLIQRQMSGLSKDMLRFSTAELCALARMQRGVELSAAEAEAVIRSFDGWITGILLGTFLGDVQGLGERGLQISQENLFAYAQHEIFKDTPEALRFLQEASILEQMLPGMCNALLDMENAEERLQDFERRGLFVTCSKEGEQTVYSCPPALRELLSEKLREHRPRRFLALHHRAAELWRETHNYEQSMHHALTAQAYELAMQVFCEASGGLLRQGKSETLLNWFELLPAPLVASHPRLLLTRARIASVLGETRLVFPFLDRAQSALDDPALPAERAERRSVQAEIDVLKSKWLFQLGKYQEARDLCQRVLEDIDWPDTSLRAEAYMRLGVCANLLGEPAVGLVQLQKALQLWGPGTIESQVADIHGALGNTYSLLGNFALAEHHLTSALICCEQLHNEQGKIDNLIRIGTTRVREDKPDEAEKVYLLALKLAGSRSAFQRGEAYALMNLGSLYLELAQYPQALQLTERGITLARSLGDRYLVNCLLANLASIYLHMGDSISALQLLSEMEVPGGQEEQAGYELARYELTCGLVYLCQGRLDEALASLSSLEGSVQNTGLSREYVQLQLRLAICHFMRVDWPAAARYARSLTSVLHTCKGYKRLVLLECQQFSSFLHAVQTRDEMADLCLLLGLERLSSPASAASATIQPVASAAKPRLAFFALGKPSVLIDDVPVTRWRMARARELCFLLLNAGGPLSKEEIITALWEEEVSDSADQTLYLIIHYLRKALGESTILSRGQTYRLDLTTLYGGRFWYDVDHFLLLHKQAREALQAENSEPARAALLEMLKLYRGDYLQSVYSNWCLARRDELRTLYLEAHRWLAQIAWKQEAFAESIEHWQYILSQEDYQEDVHFELMRCYARTGQRALALRQYQQCEEILLREFGIRPGERMQKLRQQLASASSTRQRLDHP